MNPMVDGYVPPCPSPTLNALAAFLGGLLLASLLGSTLEAGARWLKAWARGR